MRVPGSRLGLSAEDKMAAGFGRRKGKYTAHAMPIRQQKNKLTKFR